MYGEVTRDADLTNTIS